jgi:subtilisin-like proprotein convertase family protein
VPTGLTLQAVKVDVDITHTYRGDLEISLVSPDGKVAMLSNKAGGSADNYQASALDVTSLLSGAQASGTWKLKVRDLAGQDVGTINLFKLSITSSTGGATSFQGQSSTAAAIPDNNTAGVSSTITASAQGLQVQTVQVKLNISHSWRGDVQVVLTSPAGESRTVVAPASNDSADNIVGTFDVAGFTAGSNGSGTWTLKVTDKAAQDTGTLNSWSLGVNTTAL